VDQHRVLTVDRDMDLRLFSAYLWQRGVAHRVYEERGTQVLEVADPRIAARVRAEFEAWRRGELQLRAAAPAADRERVVESAIALQWVRDHPALCATLLLAIICFPVTWDMTSQALSPMLRAMTIVDPVAPEAASGPWGSLFATLAQGEIWRLFTPALLHFGTTHLMFNLVAVAIFGRSIERGAGPAVFTALIVTIAVVSNVAQFVTSGYPLFGGLSGVAYGLFGFVAVRSRQLPDHPTWALNPAFTISIVALLALMTTGITEAFGLYIAHAAHWIGLGVGVLIALIWRPGQADRRHEANSTEGT
jgi:GlpG protein